MQMDFEEAATILATILQTPYSNLDETLIKVIILWILKEKKGDNRLRVARPLTLCIWGTFINSEEPDEMPNNADFFFSIGSALCVM